MGKRVGKPRSEYLCDFPNPLPFGTTRLTWVGYRPNQQLSKARDESLLYDALPLNVPQQTEIPREFLQLHVPGYWFQVHEDTWVRRPLCCVVREARTLLASESYQEITAELERRGILQDYEKMKALERRVLESGPKTDFRGTIFFLTGTSWKISMKDSVSDPQQQAMYDKLDKMAKWQKQSKGKTPLPHGTLNPLDREIGAVV